ARARVPAPFSGWSRPSGWPTAWSRLFVDEILVFGPQGRDAHDQGLYPLGAPQPVGGVRLDVHHRAGLHLYHVVVHFHLAATLQDVVNLGAFAVVVLHRILDEGDVKVAHRRVGGGQRPRALPARAGDRGRVLEATDEVAPGGGRRHARSPEIGPRAGFGL